MTRLSTRRILPAAALALAVAFATTTTATAQDEADMRSTLDGVYTEEQAGRGEQLMWNICAECHFDEDFQGPFMADWSGASVWGLFESVWSTMPEDNPGGLPATDYADAIAYMFRLNGIPAGDEELGSEQDVLERIMIEWDDGDGPRGGGNF
jgi:hypothetical protein